MLNHHQRGLYFDNLLSFNKLLPINNEDDHICGSKKGNYTYTCIKVKLNKLVQGLTNRWDCSRLAQSVLQCQSQETEVTLTAGVSKRATVYWSAC